MPRKAKVVDVVQDNNGTIVDNTVHELEPIPEKINKQIQRNKLKTMKHKTTKLKKMLKNQLKQIRIQKILLKSKTYKMCRKQKEELKNYMNVLNVVSS